MPRLLLIFTVVVLSALPVLAEEPATKGFVDRKFKNSDGSESPYVVFVPHNYDPEKEYPVILFLHGSGETKGGSKMPVEVGFAPHVKRYEKDFPAFVVIPQSEKRTWRAESDDGKRAIAILDEVMKEFKIDPKRQYLTGLSMGGFGTWSLAFFHSDRWACIAPVCGGGDPRGAEKIKDIPCWCWHGDADRAVNVKLSRDMIDALKKAGGKPIYTELANVGHNSWDAAYATPDLLAWMLKQKKE